MAKHLAFVVVVIFCVMGLVFAGCSKGPYTRNLQQIKSCSDVEQGSYPVWCQVSVIESSGKMGEACFFGGTMGVNGAVKACVKPKQGAMWTVREWNRDWVKAVAKLAFPPTDRFPYVEITVKDCVSHQEEMPWSLAFSPKDPDREVAWVVGPADTSTDVVLHDDGPDILQEAFGRESMARDVTDGCAACANVAATSDACSAQVAKCHLNVGCDGCVACLDLGGDPVSCDCTYSNPTIDALRTCLANSCPVCGSDENQCSPPQAVDASGWCGPAAPGDTCEGDGDCQQCNCVSGHCGAQCVPYRGICGRPGVDPPCCDGYVCTEQGCQPPPDPGYCRAPKSICDDDSQCCNTGTAVGICALDLATQDLRCQ